MSKNTKAKSQNQRTLYVKFLHNGGERKVTIPAGCKVTFGPVCPGTKGSNNGEGSIALRVYNGASQIACFVRVESFYETDSVTCIHRCTKRAVKQQAYQEGGVDKQRSVAVEVSEWKDELAEDETGAEDAFLAMKEENSKLTF